MSLMIMIFTFASALSTVIAVMASMRSSQISQLQEARVHAGVPHYGRYHSSGRGASNYGISGSHARI